MCVSKQNEPTWGLAARRLPGTFESMIFFFRFLEGSPKRKCEAQKHGIPCHCIGWLELIVDDCFIADKSTWRWQPPVKFKASPLKTLLFQWTTKISLERSHGPRILCRLQCHSIEEERRSEGRDLSAKWTHPEWWCYSRMHLYNSFKKERDVGWCVGWVVCFGICC